MIKQDDDVLDFDTSNIANDNDGNDNENNDLDDYYVASENDNDSTSSSDSSDSARYIKIIFDIIWNFSHYKFINLKVIHRILMKTIPKKKRQLQY